METATTVLGKALTKFVGSNGFQLVLLGGTVWIGTKVVIFAGEVIDRQTEKIRQGKW